MVPYTESREIYINHSGSGSTSQAIGSCGIERDNNHSGSRSASQTNGSCCTERDVNLSGSSSASPGHGILCYRGRCQPFRQQQCLQLSKGDIKVQREMPTFQAAAVPVQASGSCGTERDVNHASSYKCIGVKMRP